MASLVLAGDTSGSITVSAPAVSGSNTQTLVATTGTLAPIVSGTAVASTSGTSIDFTGIPSWVRRVTVVLSEVSTSGTSGVRLQLGDSGGIETTGYSSSGGWAGPSSSATFSTSGFDASGDSGATVSRSGSFVFSLLSSTSNTWTLQGMFTAGSAAGNFVFLLTGGKTLSATLDRVRITTVNGTDTFDAGTINILYE
jgi:hypothetical protein